MNSDDQEVWPGYDDWLAELDSQAYRTIEESAGSSSSEQPQYTQ